MKVNITVPSVGESITEATVSNVIKPNGSTVNKEEEILELETDKVNQVIHAKEAGTLSLTVKVGDVVKIGQVIGSIDTSKASSNAESKKESTPEPKAQPVVKKEEAPAKGPGARVFQEEYLSNLGKEEKAEVSKQAVSTPSLPKESGQKRQRMTGLRKTIAQRLVEVKNTTAMLTTFNEVDMTEIMKIRSTQKDLFEKKYKVKLGFLSFFVRACSSALKAFPDVNAFMDKDEIVYNDHHHIGIAVSTEKGLMVPVLRNCESKGFADIESSVAEFAKKARDGTVAISDLQGGTFTITNGGVFGSLLSTPILNPPQSAILGMHAIQKRPVVVNDQIVIRPMMYLALSYDHRIIDGKEAVSFLVHIKACLEDPSKLLLES